MVLFKFRCLGPLLCPSSFTDRPSFIAHLVFYTNVLSVCPQASKHFVCVYVCERGTTRNNAACLQKGERVLNVQPGILWDQGAVAVGEFSYLHTDF